MLKLASEHETGFRITLFLSGFMAYDLETGIYMRQSHGSPAFGHPTKYFLGGIDRSGFREEQLAAWPEPPKCWREHLPSPDGWPVVMAYSDAEAVRKANLWIARGIPGAGDGKPAVYAKAVGGVLTLTRRAEEGYEPFLIYDLESFRDYLGATGIGRVKFDFYGRWPVNPASTEKSTFVRAADKLFRLMSVWEREDAEAAAREKAREKAHAAGRRAAEALPTIKGTEPRGDAAVEVEHPRSSSRWWYFKRVVGPREEVYAYVAHVFATDSCTQCYEHMLWRLTGLDELADGRVAASLAQNNYAGD